ncbi:hypothetical protein [Streptomyces mirabilis]|uniref:hypothetical protein n=1 Tax=Streptomyces mirabilis TaxID=68239 RepID=UPI0036C870AC
MNWWGSRKNWPTARRPRPSSSTTAAPTPATPSSATPARAVPDACYDVTGQLGVRHHVARAELQGTALHLAGHAYLHRVETQDVTTGLVLRERDSGTEFRLPVTHTATPGLGADADEGAYAYDLAGFEAVVDITTAAGQTPRRRALGHLARGRRPGRVA